VCHVPVHSEHRPYRDLPRGSPLVGHLAEAPGVFGVGVVPDKDGRGVGFRGAV